MLAKKLMALGGYTKAEDLERDYPTMESFVEAFPQAQVLINQYKKQTGGGQQDPLTQVITAVAEQVGIDPQQLAGMLQQSPEFVTQLTQMAAQDPNQAAQALIQVLQNASQGQQAQAQQSELAQPGQMPMNPEEAMQMAYNGGSKLSKFIRKTGGDIAFPQAAPMYDDSVYRTFPPNMPRLFQGGGESEEESFGPVRTPGIPMESYAQAQGLPEVTSSQDYGSRLSSVKKNKSIGSTEGMTVSQIWTKVTGLPWSEAKKQGLTDGSYASNIALKKDLLKGVKVNKQAPKEEPFVRRSQTPAGRSAMVDNINEGYENRQGQRYIQANAPNRYTAPTQSAMDLYEAGLNYIDRNAAGVPMNYGYSAPTPSAIDLYEAGQNYIERNAAGAPRNRYVAPTPEAVDLYAAGLNYLERNSAPSNRAVVNTPRNLPFSYFSNPNMARFLGRPQSGRVYQYGGDLPSFQGDQGPSETGQQYMPVQQIPQIEITDTRPRVLMPPQAQYAEVPWWAPLATMGAAGALMTGGLPIGQVKIGDAQQKTITNAEQRADSKDFKLSQTGDGPGTEKHYLEFTNKKLNDALIRYNRANGTRYKAFGSLPKDAQTNITKNLRTLYELKYNSNAPKAFEKADRIMKMYPESSISAGVSKHMTDKSAFGRTRRNIGSRFEGIPSGVSRAGWGALGFGAAAGIPYAIDAFRDWLNGQQQTEEGAALQTNYATGTDSDQPVDAGTVYENNAPAVNESLDNTEVIDSYGNIIDNKYGGNIYAYGGGTPFGYGYFAPPMAYGGNSNAMPGIDDVDAQLQMRNNTWLDYVRNNVKNAAMPQSFRKGGAKKKKG